MANSLGEAVLDLTADSGKLEQDIAGAKNMVLGAFNGLGKLGGIILGAAFAAAGAGLLLIGKGLASSVQAAMEAQVVQSQLNAVLTSTGGIAGVTADAVNALSNALSMKTGIDDDAITSAQSLLLTFTDIGQDVFPVATNTVLDMATALNGGVIPSVEELKAQSILLGKALQDPDAGLGALKRVGVNVDELTKLFTPLMSKEEKQRLILQELAKEFGGSAEAAGKTFAGQLAILQIKMGDIQETIGTALLPVLSDLATMLGDYLNKPETKKFIEDLAAGIGNLARQAAENLPVFIKYIQDAFGWFEDNKGVVVAALAIIGTAIAAFVYTTVIPAAIAAISALWPILLIMAAIGLAAYILYEAWTNNWGGIRDAIINLWTVIQPYFQILLDWLQIYVPIALQLLANLWNTVLLPAVQKFFGFVATVMIPGLIYVVQWLAVNVPAAIQKLISWWNTLKTTVAIVLSNIESNFKAVFGQLINKFSNFIEKGQEVVTFLLNVFESAFQSVGQIIGNVIGLVGSLLKKLQELADNMPAILQPGSPTPFEVGLWGIHDAMKALAKTSLPQLGGAFDANLAFASSSMTAGAMGDSMNLSAGGNKTYNFNMQKSDLNEDQLMRALQRSEMLYG